MSRQLATRGADAAAPTFSRTKPESRHFRWWALVLLALAAHLGLILWLGDRGIHPPRASVAAPALRLTDSGVDELLSLSDPTMFALPHRQAFSGPAWLVVTQHLQGFFWSEPPGFLAQVTEPLISIFQQMPVRTPADFFPFLDQPEPVLFLPAEAPLQPFVQSSALRVTGDLAGRRLLTPLELPPWTATDVLTNTVIQLRVDRDGIPVSAVLLSRSGKQEADEYSLRKAAAARFEPLRSNEPESVLNPLTQLMWGQLVFTWHTLPMPATNGATAPRP
jgi:hypothetical protein